MESASFLQPYPPPLSTDRLSFCHPRFFRGLVFWFIQNLAVLFDPDLRLAMKDLTAEVYEFLELVVVDIFYHQPMERLVFLAFAQGLDRAEWSWKVSRNHPSPFYKQFENPHPLNMTHANLMADVAGLLWMANLVDILDMVAILFNPFLAVAVPFDQVFAVICHLMEIEHKDLVQAIAGPQLGEHMGPDPVAAALSHCMVMLDPRQEDELDHKIAYQVALTEQSKVSVPKVCNLLESCMAFKGSEDRIAHRPEAVLLDHIAPLQCQAPRTLV